MHGHEPLPLPSFLRRPMTLSCLLDFAAPQAAPARRLRHAFGQPSRRLVAHRLQEVPSVLAAVEAAARAGRWCVGWLAYEAAPAFDPALAVHGGSGPEGLPLAWFAVYDQPQPWPEQPAAGGSAHVHWQDGGSRSAFDAAQARIQQDIAAGAVYQVNYTAPWHGRLQGDPLALFEALRRAQGDGYVAYVDAAPWRMLSVSPELFFDWTAAADGRGTILTRPMKGTAARSALPAEDAERAAQLRASAKERAENVMIVDLLRNDLSRIAKPHSVRVPHLLQVQAWPTVWQMTSDVVAQTRRGTTLADVFAALFPCGSVTGAPKVAAMRIIRALEPAPRGVYCGALGVVRPGADGGFAATFNVPIRTLQLHGDALRCDVGSGIVWAADADAEWREWQAKRAFAERASAPFSLLETLALKDGRLQHERLHLARMQAAAAHFGYPWDAAAVRQCLDRVMARHGAGHWRLRLLLDASGQLQAETGPLKDTPAPVCLQLAARSFDHAHSEFTSHKTTRRQHYQAFAPGPGVFDTVLYNAQGQLTESTFGNIAVLLHGRWLTPAASCGLLPGVGRALALQAGRVQEAVIHLDEVAQVRDWAFMNSLRGWLPARLVPAAV